MKKNSQQDPEVLSLIVKLQEQVALLDKKVDTLISRSLPVVKTPSPAPAANPVAQKERVVNQPQGGSKPGEQPKGRPMYAITCAECKVNCEIPFKPTGDRPVYCKACFQRRKSGGAPKPSAVESKPKVTVTPDAVVSAAPDIRGVIVKPVVKDKKKPVAIKKPAPKKKPSVLKKKK